jgi:multisubunit Na+/H+ antiporter MnhC subunit
MSFFLFFLSVLIALKGWRLNVIFEKMQIRLFGFKMKNRTSLLGCLLIFLIFTVIPIAVSSDSIVKPTVSPPLDWYQSDESPYGDYVGQYDAGGSGLLQFTDGVDFDFVMIFYEKAPDFELTAAALETKATLIRSAYHSSYPLDHTGTLSIAGVWAGYAISYDSSYDVYLMDLCLVKNGVFIYAYAYYDATTDDWNQVTQLLDSISVKEPEEPLPWPLIIGAVIAVVVVVVVVVVLLKKFRKPKTETKSRPKAPPRVCRKCGYKIEENTSFCPECGTPLNMTAPLPPKPSPEDKRFCMQCGNRLDSDSIYCDRCGATAQDFGGPDTQTCPACGKEIPATAKFCNECGAKQAPV